MDTTTFSVAAAASELATKVRACLGGQTTTTPDVAPASYQLETTAATSDKYAVVLAAVYTVGPRSLDDKLSPATGSEEPLLRRAEHLAAPDHVSPAGSSCPRHVRSLLQRHVGALAAGMSLGEILHEDSLGFTKEVLRRVNRDLLLLRGGLLVYGAGAGRLAVEVPCDTVCVAVVAEEGAAAPASTAWTRRRVAKLTLNMAAAPGEALSVSVDADEGGPPATTTRKEAARVVGVGVGAVFHTELRGQATLRLKITGKVIVNQ